MNIKEILFLIIGLQTLVIFIVLFFYKSKKKPVNQYLSFFFMTICVEITMYFLLKSTTNPALHYLPFRFDFLTLTFLFFYANDTAGIRINSKIKYYIPAIIEVIVLTIAFSVVLSNSANHDFLQKKGFDLYLRIFSSTYIIIFSLLIIRIILQHKKLLSIHFSDTKFKSLQWLIVFCVGCIVLNILRHMYYTFQVKTEFVGIMYFSLSLFLLYYITIASLVQININNVIPSQANVEEKQRELEEIMRQIKHNLLENKTYLDPNINLKNFAKSIGIPERNVSKAINKINNKNFSNYINYYRIEEFKRLIASEAYKKYSISAIANEVGFSSRASFYKNFKEIEGVSPTNYFKDIMV